MSDKIYNEEGLMLYTKKQYLDALNKFDMALKINSHEAYYYKNKGFCFFHLKKFEEAIDEYNNALRIDPKNSSFYNNIGNALSNLKKYEEAIAAYTKAIELDPQEILYKNNLNNALKINKKKDSQVRESREFSSCNDLIDLSTSINHSTNFRTDIKKHSISISEIVEDDVKDKNTNELDRILIGIKSDPKTSDSLIKTFFNEIKNCSTHSTYLYLDKFVCFIKGLLYENNLLKEKIKKGFDEKIHLKSEFEHCVNKVNELNVPSMRKLIVPDFSISILNLNLNNIDLTAKEYYNIHRNDHRGIEYYTCKICCNLVMEPKSCDGCDDLFCKKCLNNWLSRKNFCPHCKSSPFLERNINKLNQSFLNNIEIDCPLDCKESFKYGFLNKHFEKCLNTIKNYKCNLCQEEFIIKRKDFSQVFYHMEACNNIVYECGYCNEKFTQSFIQDHTKVCAGLNLKKCFTCGIQYPEKFSKAHYDFFCGIICDTNKLISEKLN